jgi:hypothetical protein
MKISIAKGADLDEKGTPCRNIGSQDGEEKLIGWMGRGADGATVVVAMYTRVLGGAAGRVVEGDTSVAVDKERNNVASYPASRRGKPGHGTHRGGCLLVL